MISESGWCNPTAREEITKSKVGRENENGKLYFSFSNTARWLQCRRYSSVSFIFISFPKSTKKKKHNYFQPGRQLLSRRRSFTLEQLIWQKNGATLRISQPRKLNALITETASLLEESSKTTSSCEVPSVKERVLGTKRSTIVLNADYLDGQTSTINNLANQKRLTQMPKAAPRGDRK